MKTLIVVDMQNDFIDGALGTAEAVAIVPNVCSKLEEARNAGSQIIFTRDTHFEDYLKTPEGVKLPVEHCIQNTFGWSIIPELQNIVQNYPCIYVNKPIFGSVDLMDYFSDSEEQEIEFCGVCTDICVVSNALMAKSYFPKAKISVDPNACAGTSISNHISAIDVMRSCQIDIIE
jgi:nicotinamidase-related amidase